MNDKKYEKLTHKDLSWYIFKNPTRENFNETSLNLSIDPYIKEKFLKKNTSDKAISFGNDLFISLSFPDYEKEKKKYNSTPIKFILTENSMVSGIYAKNEGMEKYKNIFKTAPSKATLAQDNCIVYPFVYAFEEIYKNLFFELNYIRKEIDFIEENIFSENEKRMVKKISISNRKLIDFKKIMRDHKKVWSVFSNLSKTFFKKKTSWDAINNLGISNERILAEVEELSETLHELRDTNNSLLNSKQSDTMKKFTLIAFLTLPMTLFLSIISLPTTQKFIIGRQNDLHIILWILFIIFMVTLIYSLWKKWWE